MGKDNQDYFKRAGRSIGPAGPLEHFKAKVSQKQALLRRDMEHRLPSERPVTGERPAGWLTPPEGQGHPAQAPQPRPGGPQAPRARAGGPSQAPLPAQPPTTTPQSSGAQARAQPKGPDTKAAGRAQAGPQPPQAKAGDPTMPRAGGPQPPRKSPPRAKTIPEKREPGGLAVLETRNQDPEPRRRPGPVATAIEGASHELEPREQEAPYGFGIPASEEAALGREREPRERFGHPHEGRPHAPWLEARHPKVSERMARRFPRSFRLIGQAADVFDRPIRRVVDRLHTLGEIARRS
ncbi:MAG TPA: hypothetical protein VGD74_12280 [Vulgatibacter sp.]